MHAKSFTGKNGRRDATQGYTSLLTLGAVRVFFFSFRLCAWGVNLGVTVKGHVLRRLTFSRLFQHTTKLNLVSIPHAGSMAE